jgi:DNA-directed RNA polymerase I subunit RPA2
MSIKLMYKVNDGAWHTLDRDVGMVPVMLRSNRCHLNNLSPAQLAAAKEETEELGGYFIVNGIEKIIRMLVVQRRNHPMALIRGSFTKRGSSYTNMGVQIRCVRPDQTSQSIVLHYLSDGNVMFRFSWRKNEYLIPVVMILKALAQTSDKEIFEELVPSGERENTFLTDRVESLLRAYKKFDLYSREETLQYLGDKFRRPLAASEDMTNEEVGKLFLKKVALVHLNEDRDKFHLLL